MLIVNRLPSKNEFLSNNTEIIIPENKKEIYDPIHLLLTKSIAEETFSIDSSKEVANLDLDKILFPLTLRRWRKGDSFYPLGMNTKKKLSDYFIDRKFSVPEKEKIWLLCSGTQIIWIVGNRIDNRVRVTPQTKEVLQVRWIEEK
jgi:tRNA(Ile)-lysidine synthase